MEKKNTLSVFTETSEIGQYSSFAPDDRAAQVKLYNAINSPDHRLSDFINKPIAIKDVVITRVKLTASRDDVQGNWVQEPEADREGYRVVLIDMEGKSYTATSTGIYNSVCTLRNVFGTLHFEDGMKAEVKQIPTKNGKTLTLALCE